MRSNANSRCRWLARGGVCSLVLLGVAVLRGGGTLKLIKHSDLLPRFTAPASSARAKMVQAYGKLPLRFETNQGQADPEVKFLSRGNGYTLFLAGKEAVLTLKKSDARSQKSEPTAVAVLRMKWVGANTTAKAVGLDELPGKSNYFIGNDSAKWLTNVPTYAKVKYTGVYRGVDLVYYGNQRQLEFDFVVQPGADPTRIVLHLGAGSPRRLPAPVHPQEVPLRIDRNGDLVLATRGGEVRFHKPVVYQPPANASLPPQGLSVPSPESKIQNPKLLDTRYVLKGDNQVTFEVGPYDRSKVLVIDPVLSYATYLGGDAEPGGEPRGIAVDSSGNAYITGSVGSADFPTTTGAFQDACPQVSVGGCALSAFVAKLNPAGSGLVYSTYLGGSGQAFVEGIAVDASGNAYVTGSTNASDYPATAGAFQPQPAPHVFVSSGFVTKLNAEGSALVYSTYLGDNGGGSAIAVDASGSAYVAGSTVSLDFPVTAGAFQTACKNPVTGGCAGENTFVTKFNPAGSALAYSTYLGGSSKEGDVANGIAVDSSGNAYVAGTAHSSDFPTTPGAFQTKFVGGECKITPPPGTMGPVGTRTCSDVFVSKLNAAGSNLVYSTFLAGSLDDVAAGIAVDASGNAYVAGTTDSSDFPTTSGAFRTPSGRVFVTKLNPAGSGLVYSAHFGGSGSDSASSMALDASGDAFVAGRAVSTDFPTQNPIQARNAGGASDAFLVGVNSTGAGLLFSTYLGGSDEDYANGVAVDPEGNVYLTGHTVSTNFPVTPGALKTSSSLYCQTGTNPTIGYSNPCGSMFVAKISSITPIGDFALSPSPTSATTAAGQSAAFTLKVTPVRGFRGNIALTCAGAPRAATCSVSPSAVTLNGSQESMAGITVTTTARTAALPNGGPKAAPPGLGVWESYSALLRVLSLLVLATLAAFARAERGQTAAGPGRLALTTFCTALIVLGTLACGGTMGDPGGGGGTTGTPPGTYTLTLGATYTGSSSVLNHEAQISLTVN